MQWACRSCRPDAHITVCRIDGEHIRGAVGFVELNRRGAVCRWVEHAADPAPVISAVLVSEEAEVRHVVQALRISAEPAMLSAPVPVVIFNRPLDRPDSSVPLRPTTVVASDPAALVMSPVCAGSWAA